MKINEALKLLGQGQVYYPKLAQKIGIIEAIFLTYLGYWADDDNQLYRKNSEIVEDTAMSIDQLKRVQTKFIKQGWITKDIQGLERITLYEIRWDKIKSDLSEEFNEEYCQQTQEITAEFTEASHRDNALNRNGTMHYPEREVCYES
jgi:TPP-dependent pyruvate/acetoin dehydrogenase alpha subunit